MRSVLVPMALTICLLATLATAEEELGAALALAGENRAELERVLEHYRELGDPQKLEAAQFLIENMEGHSFVQAGLQNAAGEVIEFDARTHADLGACERALDALEVEHGELEFERQRVDEDLQTITADFLIENIDLAFEVWHTRPWAQGLSFETFKQHILPYRGSNEPIDSWRRPCFDAFADLAEKLEDPTDAREAAGHLQGGAGAWIGFDSRYYLHPTDQGFSEMRDGGRGRCEDITNMTTYVMRANGVASAADYTPYWADRDNNHAWSVILDADGQGRAGLSHRAAKIYRKTYAHQRGNLAFQLAEGEGAPRWLAGKTYLDVTEQYLETTDVPVEITRPIDGRRFAYLCVFNGGEWRAIHWSPIEDGKCRFDRMGRNIVYLPAFFADDELIPAADPFVLDGEGAVQRLATREESRGDACLLARKEPVPLGGPLPSNLKQGRTYDFYVWGDGWQKWGDFEAGEYATVYKDVPHGGLYWLVERGSRRLERIFTLDASGTVQRW